MMTAIVNGVRIRKYCLMVQMKEVMWVEVYRRGERAEGRGEGREKENLMTDMGNIILDLQESVILIPM